jgi:hypothetical protein
MSYDVRAHSQRFRFGNWVVTAAARGSVDFMAES